MNMLRSIADCKVSSNLIILEDTVYASCTDLFLAFLNSFCLNESFKEVHLFCLEYPSNFYINLNKSSREKIYVHDFFSDPYGWDNKSINNIDAVLLDSSLLSNKIIFIDSLYHLIVHLGFFKTFKILKNLKLIAQTVVSVIHTDLRAPNEVETLDLLSSISIKYLRSIEGSGLSQNNEKIVEIKNKKPNGKVNIKIESYKINENLKLISHVLDQKSSFLNAGNKIKNELMGLTTFELGLKMSDNEKKAKEQLILPYLRNENKSTAGNILYSLEAGDFEDDPDDDLDI